MTGQMHDKLIQHLQETHAMELALARTLQAHAAMAPEGPYRDALGQHLRETRGHAERVRTRLRELGGRRTPLQLGYGVAQRLAGQLLALGKAPLDMARGGADPDEKLLKNAKDECATEALEIATYDALEQLARQAGDEQTARLAAENRADEERMLATLRAQLPALSAATIGAEPTDERTREREQHRSPLPDYDELTVEDVTERLEQLTPAQLRHVATYERSHKGRRGVLDAVARHQHEHEHAQAAGAG